VGDDELHFLPIRLCEEGVEEDEAARSAEAGDVRIQLVRSAARVRDQDPPDRDPCPGGKPLQAAGQLSIREGREAAEDRLQEDGGDEAQGEDDESGRGGDDHGPGRWPETGGGDEARERARPEEQGEREPLQTVKRPPAQ
jgi:hypothetical protein